MLDGDFTFWASRRLGHQHAGEMTLVNAGRKRRWMRDRVRKGGWGWGLALPSHHPPFCAVCLEAIALLSRDGRPGRPVVLFESPARIAATLTTLARLAPGSGSSRAVIGAVLCRELTKVHEEVRCFPTVALAAREVARRAAAGESTMRGEWVIVLHVAGMSGEVEAAGPSDIGTDAASDSHDRLRMALELMQQAVGEGGGSSMGLKPAAAVRVVSEMLGVPRRRLYEAWIRLQASRT